MSNQDEKAVLVTGGSRGIGSEIVRVMVGSGYKVAFTYHQRKDLADELVKDIGISQVIAVKLSAQDPKSISCALQTVHSKLGNVDILVNNAGMAQEKPFLNINQQDFDNMVAVNLRGPFFLCQQVIPEMTRKGWGRIVNISSIGGQWGGYNQVHYAAAKAGLINLTRSLARIYSKDGITINAVAPGLIGTEMIDREINSELGKEKIRGIPAGRIGGTKEVADTVKFLVSNEAGYITGQTVNVNGGMYFI